MMKLFVSKPVVLSVLGVAAVGLSGAGGWLQSQTADAVPQTIVRIVPSPGSTTVIIKRTKVIVPGPGAHTIVPSPGSTVVVPGGPVPSPGPVTEPGPTSEPEPSPSEPVPSSTSPAPSPSPTCIHPPAHKCRHRPHSAHVDLDLWLLP